MDDTQRQQYNQLRLAAMDLLARRDHSRLELSQKLSRRNQSPELINRVIDTLASENLFNEQRFIETFVHSRANAGFGPLRIRQDLKQKGISSEEINQSLAQADIDWRASARELYQRRLNGQPPPDYNTKQKHARYMAGRGFDSDTIFAVIGERDD